MVRTKNVDMCNGPLLKNVIVYTVPIIITSIIQLLFNAADLAVVGQFCGSKSVAAVGSTSSLVSLFVNFFIGFSSGAGIAMAQAMGSGDSNRIHKVVHTAIPVAMICGAVVSALCFAFSTPMLELMDAPRDVLPLSSIYLKIYSFGSFFNMVYNFGASLLRAAGNSKSPLYILSFAGVLNVALNVVFVVLFNMDVVGVATATAISHVLSAVLVIYVLSVRTDGAKLVFKSLKIYAEPLKKIIFIGLPSGIQSSIFALSNVMIQSSINSFGTAAVSGSAASASIEGFVHATMNGFCQSAINFTGQNMGAKKYNRLPKILVTCISCAAVSGIVLGLTAILFRDFLLSIYIPDSAAAFNFGERRLIIIGLTYFICGFMDPPCGALRSMGKSMYTMIICILCVCGIRIAFVSTLFKVPLFHSFECLLLTYPVSWAICATILIVVFVFQKKKLMRQIKSE